MVREVGDPNRLYKERVTRAIGTSGVSRVTTVGKCVMEAEGVERVTRATGTWDVSRVTTVGKCVMEVERVERAGAHQWKRVAARNVEEKS